MVRFLYNLWQIEAVKKFVFIIFTMALCYFLLKGINWLFKKKLNASNQIHLKFIKSVIQGIVVIYSIFEIGMQFEGMSKFITTIVASSSFLVVVLGFAAQESLGNIINGIFISIFKPFEIGDRIRISSLNLTGYIEDITLRHTIIRTFNNSKLIVPNSSMNKEVLENFHFNDKRYGNFLDIQISFDSDIHKAIEIMSRVIEVHPNVIDMRTEEEKEKNDPVVGISVREIGENGIFLRATIWTDNVDSNFSTCSDLRIQIKKAFDSNHIEIAHPYVNVNLKG